MVTPYDQLLLFFRKNYMNFYEKKGLSGDEILIENIVKMIVIIEGTV